MSRYAFIQSITATAAAALLPLEMAAELVGGRWRWTSRVYAGGRVVGLCLRCHATNGLFYRGRHKFRVTTRSYARTVAEKFRQDQHWALRVYGGRLLRSLAENFNADHTPTRRKKGRF